MKRVIGLILAFLILTSGIGTAFASADSAGRNINISYRFASKQEGSDLLLGNTAYYAGFSQNDLDYRMHRQGAAMEEYLAFAKEQVLDFTEAEKELIASHMAILTAGLEQNGCVLPPLDEIVFIQTTMEEENDVLGYTHGTQIYVAQKLLQLDMTEKENEEKLLEFLGHELFHCLTRCNPDFRAAMYQIIHFIPLSLRGHSKAVSSIQCNSFCIPPQPVSPILFCTKNLRFHLGRQTIKKFHERNAAIFPFIDHDFKSHLASPALLFTTSL